ncbi:MAG: hypothetical protein Q9200_004162 [Gallowayella weberi]
MAYYNGNETGQPVGLLPPPYYWWEAGAMFDQMIQYWYYTGDKTYNDVVTQGLLAQISPDKDFMPSNQTLTEGNDDQAFWAFAAMSAAELNFPDPPPKQPSWLALAQAVFNEQASRWETTTCGGGLRWQIFSWNKGYEYKNSISNGCFFQLAARLARYTGNQTYADWATKTWDWMESTPLVTPQFNIYDGVDMKDNCSKPIPLQWTYNVGTFLMGAANLYNYTDGKPRWRKLTEDLLNGSKVFFPPQLDNGKGNIMQEVACEPQQSCNYDQPSFKAYLSRWMAATTQIAPFTKEFIMPKLQDSAKGAAKQCSGAPNGGTTCGRTWNTATWDGKLGVGEQMSALSVIQANLISKVAPPVTADRGGTSKSNPEAGTGTSSQTPPDPLLTRQVTMGDKAGAGILTAIVLGSLLGSTWWISFAAANNGYESTACPVPQQYELGHYNDAIDVDSTEPSLWDNGRANTQVALTSGLQRRQTASSSISVPAFGYGYYSNIYPTGDLPTGTAARVQSPSTTSTSSVNSISAAGSGSRGSSYGPVGATPEEAFVASMCQPVNVTNQPDLHFPCNKLLLYESPCLYGQSFEVLLKNSGSDSPAIPLLSANDQFKCFCADEGPGQDYWQNSVYCSECRRLHGASARNMDNYAPAPYVKAFSAAYCAQVPSRAAALLDYATIWTSTGTIDLGTSTGGSDVLGSSTDVSLYTASTTAATSTTVATTTARVPPTTRPEQPSRTETAVNSAVTSSPTLSGLLQQRTVVEETRGESSPLPELSSTAASSPNASCAHLTIENEGLQDPFGLETASSKGRLNSLSPAEARSGPCLSLRSSSPAKRLASQMDGTHGGDAADDVEMEDSLAQGSPQDRHLSGSREPAKAQRRKSQSQQNRHKREMSLDPLASEPAQAEGKPLPNRSRPTSGVLPNGTYFTPQSGASTILTSQSDASTAQPRPGAYTSDLPSIDEQIAQVIQLTNRPLQEGQKGFVISCKWLGRVMARGSDLESVTKYGKEAVEGPIGPVDNSGIDMVIDQSFRILKDEKGQPFIPLRPELSMREDFEIVPEEAWELILRWYGLAQGSPIIVRYCHNTSSSDVVDNLQYELRPPIFTIVKMPDRRLGMTKQALDEKDALPVKVLASRNRSFQSFLKDAKKGTRIDVKKKVRVWRILVGLTGESQSGMITPAQSRSNSPALATVPTPNPGSSLVLDVSRFAELQFGSERELIEAKDETANEGYIGHLTLNAVGLSQDSVIVLEEQIGGPAGGEWVAEAAINKAQANGVPISITKHGNTKVQKNLKSQANTSRTASPAPSGMMTRGRARKDGRTRGTIGLSNLGNTCYMNSALQCIRSCEELSMYFLQDRYKRELNPNNPLAHNGMVAKAYATLIREMYGDGTGYAFAPKTFKNVIGKYGPSFSGYGQQDSQEFLLFLLDGLQEDLNRIQRKPYIEKPDSTDEMVNNPAALKEMAAKCWDIYKARNDSVITDLFAGMYKSTVVCPVCDKVSIIFDPFNNLTLQLPVENVWSRDIEYYSVHSQPFKISIDIDKNSTFGTMKQHIATKVGADAKKLILAEVYRNKFYKVFQDDDTIVEERIQDNDVIVVYELEAVPTNWPRPKKPAHQRSTIFAHQSATEEELPDMNSPQADTMLVTLHHRHTRPGLTRSQQQRSIFGVPGLIIVTREEAKDYDEILRKVLGNIATLTTRDFLREYEEPDQSPEDSDTVLMGTEEGDSSSESKIQAHSVDSEDGMIDISMAETTSDPKVKSRGRYPPTKSQTKPLPKVLQPGSFIMPEVRNLFTMKYSSSGETIPPSFGTSASEESKDLPTIESRMRPSTGPSRTSTQLQNRLRRLGSASSSDEDIDSTLEQVHSFQTPNSDSDDDDLPPVQQLTQPPHQGFSRFTRDTPRNKKGLITYSRQGKHRSEPTSQDEDPSTPGRPELIRLGEQIYIDWTNEGYEALFGGTGSRHDAEPGLRGLPTFDDVSLRSDPELDEKRRLRLQRRKNGVTLNDCLDEFGKAEILSENDAWYCPRCKEHRRASKTFELWTAPDILVIHLKRFSSQGRLRDKLDVTVDFPVEGLDLTQRVASQEDGRSPIYDLFAVDNHYGGLGGGHYTAYAQNFFDKGWYDYNDSAVSRCRNPQNVVSSAAYLLFYRRRSDRPLGGPFFEPTMRGAEEPAAESQPTSDTASPTGEGKRLDGSSRNGSSSALRGVGAAHQAGGGGDGRTAMRTGVDDDLPSYSGNEGPESTLESMDVDEGIADIYEPLSQFGSRGVHQSWSFSQLRNDSEDIQVGRAPAASENGSENLFDGESTKAATSPSSEVGDRLADFADDEGTTSGAFGPMIRGDTPLQVEPPLVPDEDVVAEVTLPDGDTMFRDL